MSKLEVTGTIKVVRDVQVFAKGFSKREIVVELDGSKYPQTVAFELVKEAANLVHPTQVGQQVAITFDLRGNEYKGKYYVSLNALAVTPQRGIGYIPPTGPTTPVVTPEMMAAYMAQQAAAAAAAAGATPATPNIPF